MEAEPAVDAPPPAPAEPPPPATATVTPTELLLELPATPSELRPSLLSPPPAPAPTVDGLHALDEPLTPSVEGSLETLRAEALRHLRQEGSWRLALRGLGFLLAVLLAFRLAFDDALPRLLLAIVGGAAGVVCVVLLLHHLNEGRRQRNLLAALTQLTNVAREHPSQLPLLAPQLDAVLTSLRGNAPVWPSTRSTDALAGAITRALAEAPPPP